MHQLKSSIVKHKLATDVIFHCIIIMNHIPQRQLPDAMIYNNCDAALAMHSALVFFLYLDQKRVW